MCLCVCAQVYMCFLTYACVCLQMCMCICVCMCICICMCVCVYLHCVLGVYVHMRVYLCAHEYMCICMPVCVCLCVKENDYLMPKWEARLLWDFRHRGAFWGLWTSAGYGVRFNQSTSGLHIYFRGVNILGVGKSCHNVTFLSVTPKQHSSGFLFIGFRGV